MNKRRLSDAEVCDPKRSKADDVEASLRIFLELPSELLYEVTGYGVYTLKLEKYDILCVFGDKFVIRVGDDLTKWCVAVHSQGGDVKSAPMYIYDSKPVSASYTKANDTLYVLCEDGDLHMHGKVDTTIPIWSCHMFIPTEKDVFTCRKIADRPAVGKRLPFTKHKKRDGFSTVVNDGESFWLASVSYQPGSDIIIDTTCGNMRVRETIETNYDLHVARRPGLLLMLLHDNSSIHIMCWKPDYFFCESEDIDSPVKSAAMLGDGIRIELENGQFFTMILNSSPVYEM